MQESFAAAQIVATLRRSKRSVLEALEQAPFTATKSVGGNEARTWSKDTLPQNILKSLEEIASARKTSVDALLASPPTLWRPRYPLGELSQESIERASLLKRALEYALAKLDDDGLTSAEFERLGVEDYRRTFGHTVSTRHWRRLFRRTLDRDGGAKNWGRLEIYLDESPARRPEFKRPVYFLPTVFRPVQELISSFENPAAPSELERDCLWIYAFEHFEQETERNGEPKAVKHATLKFLYENAPFLGKSESGIKRQFNRKLKRWIAGGRVPAAITDARRKNPGRPAPKFSEEEEHALMAKALRSGGGITQAWRESKDSGVFNNGISQHYTSTPASKSYVPSRIRELITNKL